MMFDVSSLLVLNGDEFEIERDRLLAKYIRSLPIRTQFASCAVHSNCRLDEVTSELALKYIRDPSSRELNLNTGVRTLRSYFCEAATNKLSS